MTSARRNFAVLWVANLLAALGLMAVLPMMPLYVRAELGVTDPALVTVWAGVLVAAAPLGASLVSGFWGALGDRVGDKHSLVRANAALAVFATLMVTADGPWEMLAYRVGQGVFSGFRLAPALTLVSMTTPAAKQGRVAGRLQAAMIAGSVIGAPLGGIVADVFGLRWGFVLAAAMAIVATALIAVAVVDTGERRVASEAGSRSVTARRHVAQAFGEIARSFGRGPLQRVLVPVFSVRFGASLVMPVIALFVEELGAFDGGLLATSAGLVYGAVPLATLVMVAVWGRLGDRWGHARALTFCALGTGLSLLPQAFATRVEVLYALRFLTGVFLAGIIPSTMALVTHAAGARERGRAHGGAMSAIGLAHGVGQLAGGAVAAWLGLRGLWLAAAVFAVGAGLRLAWLARGRDADLVLVGEESARERRPRPNVG